MTYSGSYHEKKDVSCMPIKYMDWRSDQDMNDEHLAMTYHQNSNHYPQLEVLTRARMKMLRNLFTQMNGAVTPAKRYFGAERIGLEKIDPQKHPVMVKLAAGISQGRNSRLPFWDYGHLQQWGTAEQLDSLDLYFVSKNRVSGRYEIFYCCPSGQFVDYVKEEADSGWGQALFPTDLDVRDGAFAVFITANLQRSNRLFGERGYRLSLLEGGRWTERLVSLSHEQGVPLVPVMTFYDKAAHELLGLDGYYDVILASLIFREEK